MRIGRGSRATLDPIGEISMGEELPAVPANGGPHKIRLWRDGTKCPAGYTNS